MLHWITTVTARPQLSSVKPPSLREICGLNTLKVCSKRGDRQHMHLILLEVRSDSPALVICQSVTVLLKQCVDARNSPVPTVFEIFQSQPPEINIANMILHKIHVTQTYLYHTITALIWHRSWQTFMSLQHGFHHAGQTTFLKNETNDTEQSIFYHSSWQSDGH